jgi:hypothetical protein
MPIDTLHVEILVLPTLISLKPLGYKFPYAQFLSELVLRISVHAGGFKPIESFRTPLISVEIAKMGVDVAGHFQPPFLLFRHSSPPTVSPQMHLVAMRSSRSHEEVTELKPTEFLAIDELYRRCQLRQIENAGKRFGKLPQFVCVVLA